MNKVILTGRLTRDAEKTQYDTKNGKQYVLKGTVAVDRPYTGNQDGRDADFFQFETWIKEDSKLPQYMLKGTLISVEGQMRQDSRKKDDGSYENYSVKVVSAKIELLSKVDVNEAASRDNNNNYTAVESKEEKKPAPKKDDKTEDIPWELDL